MKNSNAERIREAVAVFLFGPGYTVEQYKAIAVWPDGRWYKYPFHGIYKIYRKKRIHVERVS